MEELVKTTIHVLSPTHPIDIPAICACTVKRLAFFPPSRRFSGIRQRVSSYVYGLSIGIILGLARESWLD